jgi:predicted permease
MQDVKFALRGLARQPGFAAAAIGALAIGIGANTAMFSVFSGVLLRPLGFERPDELVVILNRNIRSGVQGPIAPANYLDLRASASSFVDVGAAEMWGAALTGDGPPEQISGLRMRASVFRVLGTKPGLGRLLLEADEEPGRDRIVVLTHKLWQRRFGGDPNITGRKINLSGEPYEIVGVMPASFRFPPFWATQAEMYVPLALAPDRAPSRRASSLRLFARLRPGATLEQAQADVDTVAARLAADFPETNTNAGFAVTRLHEMVTGKVEPALAILLAAVGLMLLAACANVANLLLARAVARRKEMAIRAALGAGRNRIVRQLVTESLALSVTAGVLGSAVAFWSVDLVRLWFGDALPRAEDIVIDIRVLAFAAALSIATGILFGIAPAFQISRGNAASALKETARGVHGGGGSLRRLLVGAEVALAVVLLAGAGLLARSFANLTAIDPGFRAANVLTARVSVQGTSVEPPERQLEFYGVTLDRLAALPGAVSVAAINHIPLAGDTWGTDFVLEDRPVPAPGERFNAVYRIVTPGYFRTMGTKIMRGREFNSSDANPDAPGAVINQTMARRYWPSGDAIGKRLQRAGGAWITIIGVSQDVRQREWAADTDPEIALCYREQPDHFATRHGSSMTFVVRTSLDPDNLVKPMQQAIWSSDASIPVTETAALSDIVSSALRQPRTYALFIGAFAAVALGLAALGIYGVVSYTVAQRTPEMGIRMALGGSGATVTRLVFGAGMKTATAGAVAGIAVFIPLARFMSALLHGVEPGDPATIAAVAGVVVVVTAAATYLPARRVSRIDPAVALRIE